VSPHEEWEILEPNQRLDIAVAEALGCSRARAQELLTEGAVDVDGRQVKSKGLRLHHGQRVSVWRPPADLDRFEAVDAPLEVLGEGPGWVAVDKPAGLPVHPLRHDEPDSLLQRVAARFPRIEGVGEGGLRSGVVHRLDVDTSGVQIFALDEPTFERLREAFRGHRIDKTYRAIVGGQPPEYGAVQLDLRIRKHRPALVAASEAGTGGPDSRLCPLRWNVREAFAHAALIEVRPRTGFLHQIRVSMAWLGHPILGDPVYGDLGDRAPRQMLHACRLALGEIDVASPDPADLVGVLEGLRG
jgi:23S rRNA pseudouridine1911/1915/1917 synthase